MNTLMMFNGLILGCILAIAPKGCNSQFFYTASTFPQGAVINQGYQYSTPNTFFSRSFFPGFYYNQQNNVAPPPEPEQPKPTEFPNIDLRQGPAAVRTNFIPGPSEYRGFAYHTTYDDGGSSNVVFVTGAESVQLQSLYPEQKARTLASDLTDTNAANKQSIETTLNSSFPTSFQIIRSFFENPNEGIQNFYARNNQLFKSNEATDDTKYPASTAPLQKPIPLEAFVPENNATNATATTESTTTTAANEEEAAESIIIENSRLLPNEVLSNDTKNESDAPTTTTDTPTTTDAAAATTTVSS